MPQITREGLGLIRDCIMKVVFVNDENSNSLPAKFDCLLNLSAVARIGPARVTFRADDQVPHLLIQGRRHLAPEALDSRGKSCSGVSCGRAGETEL